MTMLRNLDFAMLEMENQKSDLIGGWSDKVYALGR